MSKVTVFSATAPVPNLPDMTHSDVPTIRQGRHPFIVNLMEYAARVCYRSTARMGSAPRFVADRIAEGHADIAEHGHITLAFGVHDLQETAERSPLLSLPLLAQFAQSWSPYLVATALDADDHTTLYVTGNARAWRDALAPARPGMPVVDVRNLCNRVAPDVFPMDIDQEPPYVPPWTGYGTAFPPVQVGQATVTLLAANVPPLADTAQRTLHGSATFLVEGVSRALMAQFTRHRKGSFSVESQRYVDLDKGGWQPVVPPAIADHPVAAVRMRRVWEQLEDAYRGLRALGIRKEDARFLLPNAAETRFVVTMHFDGWQHFARLRALDRAAQWEIRGVAQAIVRHLIRLDPYVFGDQARALAAMPDRDVLA